jgi:hypothetical protein
MRVWIGDEANGIQAETTINRMRSARLKWPEGLSAASWLHETALHLYPEQICQRPRGLNGHPLSRNEPARSALGWGRVTQSEPMRGAAGRNERDFRLRRRSIRIGIRASKRKHQSSSLRAVPWIRSRPYLLPQFQ